MLDTLYIPSRDDEHGRRRVVASISRGLGLLAHTRLSLDSTSMTRKDKKTYKFEDDWACNGKWAERFCEEFINERVKLCRPMICLGAQCCQVAQTDASHFIRTPQPEPSAIQSLIRMASNQSTGSVPVINCSVPTHFVWSQTSWVLSTPLCHRCRWACSPVSYAAYGWPRIKFYPSPPGWPPEINKHGGECRTVVLLLTLSWKHRHEKGCVGFSDGLFNRTLIAVWLSLARLSRTYRQT